MNKQTNIIETLANASLEAAKTWDWVSAKPMTKAAGQLIYYSTYFVIVFSAP